MTKRRSLSDSKYRSKESSSFEAETRKAIKINTDLLYDRKRELKEAKKHCPDKVNSLRAKITSLENNIERLKSSI